MKYSITLDAVSMRELKIIVLDTGSAITFPNRNRQTYPAFHII